jgi:hypothetical protein
MSDLVQRNKNKIKWLLALVAVFVIAISALYLRPWLRDRALAEHPEFARFDPLMLQEQELFSDFEFFVELERIQEGRL